MNYEKPSNLLKAIIIGQLIKVCFGIAFLLVILGLLVMIGRDAHGQGYSKERGREKPQEDVAAAQAVEKRSAVRIQTKRWAVGFGSFFDQESTTFSAEALYMSIQWHGVGLPFVEEGTSTGLMLEGGWSLGAATVALNPSTVVTEEFEDSDVRLQVVENVDYRIWSMTRVPISVIPIRALQSGASGRMYSGLDVLIAEGGAVDRTEGFESRFVLGGDLGIVGVGNLIFEVYALQQDVPIAFAVFYGF